MIGLPAYAQETISYNQCELYEDSTNTCVLDGAVAAVFWDLLLKYQARDVLIQLDWRCSRSYF
jgi:hypothetical protein